MHGKHVWTEKTAEGLRREVRAEKFGGRWSLQSKVAGAREWTQHNPPRHEDLVTLHELLVRKYQRRRAAYEDVVAIERLLREHPAAES
jgi:hypothetical protein